MLIPRRDIEFQVFEVLKAEQLCQHAHYAEHDREVFDGVLDAASAIAVDHFAPFAAACDAHEPQLEKGRVRMIPETRLATEAYSAGGFIAAPFDSSQGGLQLPLLITQAANSLFAAANIGFYSYAILTVGAANLLVSFGSDAQRQRYLGAMLSGRFFGTMCLSEPQAGSSLTDIKSEAIRQADGSYRLRGSKMWISGGDHDLGENIIHMVLARIPGAPAGVKGISLFVVPRHRVNDDGSVGDHNDVNLAGINHKMGWRGTVNTVLSFGERNDCHAELVGEEHQGLANMFQMMNEARISVGMSAVALGYAGYQHALAYARERPQGRPAGERNTASAPVPIIRHADVRRMLLAQKAWVEGGYALVLYCARLRDELRCASDDTAKKRLRQLLELLTPMAKSWPSEFCLEANKLAIQVHGGYGYTRDYPVERLYRDNRLNHIHEGTHGIHGLDLLGRKVSMNGGAAFADLSLRLLETVDAARAHDALRSYADSLARILEEVTAVTQRLLVVMQAAPERGLANATIYLDALGHVVVAWRWLEQARVALNALPTAVPDDQDFYRGKLAACQFFFQQELPKARAQLAVLDSLDDTALTIPDAAF